MEDHLPRRQTCNMAANRADSIARDIYHATKACRRSLEECQSVTPLMEGGWAENRLGDFKLWAAGVGASARTRASLDWRLHFQPQTRIVVAGLLVTLRQLVELCKDLGELSTVFRWLFPEGLRLGRSLDYLEWGTWGPRIASAIAIAFFTYVFHRPQK